MLMVSETEKKAIEIARQFAKDPFPFPNGSLLLLISKLANQIDEGQKKLNDVYTDRNLLAMLAVCMAWELGWPAGVWLHREEPEWPVLYIELPAGQISYHVPEHEAAVRNWIAYRPGENVLTRLPRQDSPWDGHSTEMKRDRIIEYIKRAERGHNPFCFN